MGGRPVHEWFLRQSYSVKNSETGGGRIMALTKKEIIENISDKVGLSRKESMAIIEDLFEIMKDELAKGNPVMISGFGKWVVLNKKARTGRNPQTGEAITIGARKVVTFRAANALKQISA
jgi:integration host factor subunit alpha